MNGEPNGERSESEATKTTADPIAKLRRSGRNRESYDEIVELEAELRRAYIAKELRAQFVERETERYVENVRKRHAAKLTRLEQQASLARDHRRRSEELKNAEDYRRQLTEQITRKKEERCIAAEEARRERKVLTEVDRIREQRERFKAKEAKEELMEIARRERLIFQEMKDIHREEETEAEARKLLEDEIYWKEIDRRRQEARRLREERMVNRERIIGELASALTNAEIFKQERERLIGELITEDVKRELLLREKEEIVKRERMREELAANLEEQIVFTEQCKLRYLEQDRAFAEEIMKKIMEDERTVRLTAEAKRRMQLQYREDLVRLIEKRRRIRDEEIVKMKMDAEAERRREMIDMERIKEERRLLLERHASNVGDFLNRNVFTEEEQGIIAKSLQESM